MSSLGEHPPVYFPSPPKVVTSPLTEDQSPRKTLNSEVLPEDDGPMIRRFCPVDIFNVKSKIKCYT